MSDIPESTFSMLIGRLRQKRRPEWGSFVYRLFGHTNPQGNKGWIYEYFKKNPRQGYRRIIAPTTDNVYLPKNFVSNMKEQYSEEYFAINVLGQDDDSTTNLACKGYDESQLDETLQINRQYPIHITCDFNVDPMCWYICQDYGDMTYILYEVILENTTTDEAACAVAELLKNYKSHMLIINGDASGLNRTTRGVDFTYLKNRLYQEGFVNIKMEIMRKNPSIEWRMSCFNNRLKDPQGVHRIKIHPQCKYLIYNLENVEIKEGTSKPKVPTSRQIQKDPKKKYLIHPIDAVSYLICFYHPVREKSPWEEVKNADYATDIFGGKYDKRLLS